MADVIYDQLADVTYIRFGRGRRPMVVIPGIYIKNLVSAADALETQFSAFADDFTVYVIERRNEIGENETVEDMAEDTASVMKHCGIQKACIYGVSQGGIITQYIAAKHPELADKAVIVSSSSRSNPLVKSVMQGFLEKIQNGRLEALGQDFADKMYLPETVVKFPNLKTVSPDTTALDLRNFCIMARDCMTGDTKDLLPKIKCPVLVISGRLDRVYGDEESRYLAEQLGCRHLSFEGFGHAIYDENPEVLIETKKFFG